MSATMLKAVKVVFFSAVVIAASAVLNLREVDAYFSQDNLVTTKEGSVRLGKVYSEQLMTEVEVRNEKGEVLRAVGHTASIHDKALGAFKAKVDAINARGGAVNQDGTKEPLYYSDVTYTVDTKIKVRTYMLYQAEYVQDHEVTIDTREYTLTAGGQTLMSVIDELKNLEHETKATLDKALLFLSAA